MASKQLRARRRSPRRSLLTRSVIWIAVIVAGCHLAAAALLLLFRFVDPPTTAVQVQRRIESLFEPEDYHHRQVYTSLSRISTSLQHAVIAAEDGRFYAHGGIDWHEVRVVAEESRETGEISRGASTITQQLVKNLFFTTHRNPVRKLAEYTLAPMADRILGKQRTLELYLNVVEWGPGVFGAEAAGKYHFGVGAASVTRDQAARLAAILPSPLRRSPARMDRRSTAIQARMRQMGW